MPRARKRKRSADVDETGDGEDAERNGEEEVEEGEEGEEEEEVELSPKQREAERRALAGENILLLGPAGTGKSFLLRRLVTQFEAMGRRVAVTAYTGLAARNVGGSTLHSFAGIGLGNGKIEDLIKKVKRNRWSRQKWHSTQVLIIDEISMVSAELFNLLNEVGQAVRYCRSKFWGGIQIIGCGDFSQLPPIRAEYCFKWPEFHKMFPKKTCIVFERNFRQGSDMVLQRILNEVRCGRLSKRSIKILDACTHKEVPVELNIDPVHIYPRKRQVEWYNRECMAKIDEEEHVFVHSFRAHHSMRESTKTSLHKSMLKSCPCPDILVLKIGAQVKIGRASCRERV